MKERQEQPRGPRDRAESRWEFDGAEHSGDNGAARESKRSHSRAWESPDEQGKARIFTIQWLGNSTEGFGEALAVAVQPQLRREGSDVPGKRGNPNPGSATARPKNNNSIIVCQCPLRSHLPLPGSACIPCRAFPAPSPCHCRRGPSSQPGFNPVVAAARDLSRFKSRSERSQRARRFPFSRWQLSQSRPCPGQKQRLPS